MTRESDVTPPIDPDDLIAYLDGEVDAQTRQKIERCLAEDPDLLQRMREHQRAWDLLDELPREEVSDEFARTTLQMVAVAAADEVEANDTRASTHQRWFQVVVGGGLLAATLTGFWLASSRLDRPNRELLENLPIIENLEALQHADNVEFLRALEDEGLFVAEVTDEG